LEAVFLFYGKFMFCELPLSPQLSWASTASLWNPLGPNGRRVAPSSGGYIFLCIRSFAFGNPSLTQPERLGSKEIQFFALS
jgi:hypothetical protein